MKQASVELALKRIARTGLKMIKSFSCSNFRNVNVKNLKFSKINILIGPNNSRKTNFIKALSFCADMLNCSGKLVGDSAFQRCQ